MFFREWNLERITRPKSRYPRFLAALKRDLSVTGDVGLDPFRPYPETQAS
jgi:hypothetical protein